jgi:PKD repeat protein
MKQILLVLFICVTGLVYGQETSYLCNGETKTLTASVTGGTAPITYTWAGTVGGSTTGATRSVTASGTYTWTATDATGCTASGTHEIVVEPIPTIVIVAENTCLNTAQTISATGVPSGYSYSWTFDTGAIPTTSTAASQSVTYTATGTKTITLTITRTQTGSTNGCSATCTFTQTKVITIGNLTGQSSCG